MRVIGGEKRGRRLLAPTGQATRPTADRVREAAFSMLESQGVLAGATVWDLFAGSGALGIEALSRGASQATFVDDARGAVRAARANLARLGYEDERARVVCADVLKWVHGLEGEPCAPAPGAGGVDLVLADPPYAWGSWPALLDGVAPLHPLVLAETGKELELPPKWRAVKVKRYGSTLVSLARLYDPEAPAEGHRP
ncbi:MAG: RsmD family RNA methyltransferase [Acidimicrobiales bacterium]